MRRYIPAFVVATQVAGGYVLVDWVFFLLWQWPMWGRHVYATAFCAGLGGYIMAMHRRP